MPLALVETARLRLRPLTPADADALAALHGDPEVMRRIDDGRPVPRAVVVDETLPALLDEYGELPPGFGCFAVEERDSGTFAGWCALRPATSPGLTAAEGTAELGYRLRPAFWGRGYATEATRALVRHAFATLALRRVVATTMTVNTASRRVLEKSGLRLVRTFFEAWPVPIPGSEHGDVEYALDRTTWRAAGS